MRRLFLTLMLAVLSQLPVWAQPNHSVTNYVYFTEFEQTESNEIIWFWTPDQLAGPVRSNDMFYMQRHPTFYDSVITSAPSIYLDDQASPRYNGPEPVLNAPLLEDMFFHDRLDSTAVAAQEQGYYFTDEDGTRQTRITATQAGWHVIQWDLGVPFPDGDRLLLEELIDYGDRFIFVEGPLELAGIYVEGNSYIGCSGTIRLIDDLQYTDLRTHEGDTGYYYIDGIYEGTHKLAVIAGEDIVVANTPSNGRGNGAVTGEWTDGSNKHILITARLETPNGSFTFENQNNSPDDPNGWDGYWWCDPEGSHENDQDERGSIILFGAMA